MAKAEKAVAGKIPIKRNRFVKVTGADKSINHELATKARLLAGWKAYATNIIAPTPEFVIGSYHQLWRIEKSFRMSKSDLAARPIFHRTRDSIEAHLTIVFAALAITRVIEERSGWSIKKFVTTSRRYRTITIQAGGQTITAADPLPDDLQKVVTAIRGAH
jgi:transposase